MTPEWGHVTPLANPQDSPVRSMTPEWGHATPLANPRDSPTSLTSRDSGGAVDSLKQRP
jgi:hypothetical protein